jgi:uncharacterized membrane protein
MVSLFGLVLNFFGKKLLHQLSLGVVVALILASLWRQQWLSTELGNMVFTTLAVGILAEFWEFSRKLSQSE